MNRLSWTLSTYIARRTLSAIIVTLLILSAIALLIDIVELLRRASGRDIPFGIILQMALLKLPVLMEKLLIFPVLIGSMWTLTKLTRTQELIVVRASGVSVWQFLLPIIMVASVLGVFWITVFHPFATSLNVVYEKEQSRYITGKPVLLTVSDSGLWLRQLEMEHDTIAEYFINAAHVNPENLVFTDVVLFAFNHKNRFSERLDASRASLKNGHLYLERVTRSRPGQPTEQMDSYTLPTTLEIEQIQDSFVEPETISFWELPGFIQVLEEAGFSALKHKLYWHSLLARPLLFVGMVLIAAIFSLRQYRRGKISLLIASGLATGFILYFLTNIMGALGVTGSIPIIMAAWMPAAIITLFGTATLLHLEDG